MRSVATVFDKIFKNGFRSSLSKHLNSPTLEDCTGLFPFVEGLEEPKFDLIDIDSVIDSGIQVEYPFPQLFRLSSIDLLFTSHAVYQINSDMSFTRLSIDGIIPGGRWQVADLMKGWIATNGSCLVMDLAGDGNYRVVDRQVASLTEHDGRLIFGGFDYLFSSRWLEWMNSYSGDSADKEMQDFVYWTSVGMLDIDWFFGATFPSDDEIRDVLEQGTMGFAPTTGHVNRIVPYSNGLLIATDKSLTYMESIVDPTPSYSIRRLVSSGIQAVGGTQYNIMAIDTFGVLWSISNNGIKRLGFSEFLGDVNLIEYDESIGVFYLCDGTYTYVVHGDKMCRIRELVTSVFGDKTFAIYTSVKQ